MKNLSELLGRTIVKIANGHIGSDQIRFEMADGAVILFYHDQYCCEKVEIEDIAGDLTDLIGSPLTMAEEVCSGENPPGFTPTHEQDSFTWTFYKFATVKGYVTIRWYGESNGYYSEKVDVKEIKP